MAEQIESILTGINATYIAELYTRYMADPNSVDASWVSFFSDLEDDGKAVSDDLRGASWASSDSGVIGRGGEVTEMAVSGAPASVARTLGQAFGADAVRLATKDSIGALMMIRVFRVRGHLIANFDPLGLEGNVHHPELSPKAYGFTDDDMERPIFINNVLGLETATLRQILQILRETYCGSIGVVFMLIQAQEVWAWIQ